MSKRWKINVKRIVACAMSAALLITLFPFSAEAQTAKRKAVKYVDDFSNKMLVEDGVILFPKDSYSGKKAVTEQSVNSHTCHCDTSPDPVEHCESFGFKFIGDVKDVNITKQSSEIIVGKEAGAFEYEEVTYDGKLTAKDKIVRLTYVGRGETIINYSKCNVGLPYDKFAYSIGTKVNVESLPATAYKLKYDLKGGKVSSKKNLPTKIELVSEDQIISCEMPTKKGYSFSGWDFYNKAGEQIWGSAIDDYSPDSLIVPGLKNSNWDEVKNAIGGTITVKARWYKNTYSKGDYFSDSVYLKGKGMYYNVTNAWYKITSAKYGAMKVTCLGDKAYGSYSATTDIVIGEKVYWGAPFTVTAIADDAFNSDYSSKIKTITIKSTKITKMGKNAFAGLKKSTVIKVPKKMQKKYTTMLKKSGFKGKIKTI